MFDFGPPELDRTTVAPYRKKEDKGLVAAMSELFPLLGKLTWAWGHSLTDEFDRQAQNSYNQAVNKIREKWDTLKSNYFGYKMFRRPFERAMGAIKILGDLGSREDAIEALKKIRALDRYSFLPDLANVDLNADEDSLNKLKDASSLKQWLSKTKWEGDSLKDMINNKIKDIKDGFLGRGKEFNELWDTALDTYTVALQAINSQFSTFYWAMTILTDSHDIKEDSMVEIMADDVADKSARLPEGSLPPGSLWKVVDHAEETSWTQGHAKIVGACWYSGGAYDYDAEDRCPFYNMARDKEDMFFSEEKTALEEDNPWVAMATDVQDTYIKNGAKLLPMHKVVEPQSTRYIQNDSNKWRVVTKEKAKQDFNEHVGEFKFFHAHEACPLCKGKTTFRLWDGTEGESGNDKHPHISWRYLVTLQDAPVFKRINKDGANGCFYIGKNVDNDWVRFSMRAAPSTVTEKDRKKHMDSKLPRVWLLAAVAQQRSRDIVVCRQEDNSYKPFLIFPGCVDENGMTMCEEKAVVVVQPGVPSWHWVLGQADGEPLNVPTDTLTTPIPEIKVNPYSLRTVRQKINKPESPKASQDQRSRTDSQLEAAELELLPPIGHPGKYTVPEDETREEAEVISTGEVNVREPQQSDTDMEGAPLQPSGGDVQVQGQNPEPSGSDTDVQGANLEPSEGAAGVEVATQPSQSKSWSETIREIPDNLDKRVKEFDDYSAKWRTTMGDLPDNIANIVKENLKKEIPDEVLENLGKAVKEAVDPITERYEENVVPLFESIKNEYAQKVKPAVSNAATTAVEGIKTAERGYEIAKTTGSAAIPGLFMAFLYMISCMPAVAVALGAIAAPAVVVYQRETPAPMATGWFIGAVLWLLNKMPSSPMATGWITSFVIWVLYFCCTKMISYFS